jgi:PAS domain S-box-containing protein
MAGGLTELILDRAHNAAVSIDERGTVTYWNPSAERIFGRPREEVIGRPLAELIIPERLRPDHERGLARFLAEGVGPMLDRRVELTALRADGSEFPVEITISALREGDAWSFHAFVQDISERKRGELERERLLAGLRRTLDANERRFDAVVGSLEDPVTIRDRDERIVYANEAALARLGFDSSEELRETSPAAIMRDYVVRGADGRAVAMEDIPSVRILRGEPAEPLLIQTVHRETGALRWNLLKAAPLLDEQGAPEATIMIIEDVTERRRAEQQSQFLAEVGNVLGSSLDYEQTLRNVARLAVPDVVDWCAVDLFDEDERRLTVAVAHVDPERVTLAERLREYEPDRLDPEQGLGLVLRTGEPLLYEAIDDDALVAAATDDTHLELLREVGMRSALIVPMRAGGRVLGALTLVSAESGRVLDELDLVLAQQMASRAAVAIENARLYGERSRIARTLQQSLLPEQLPDIPGFELASHYQPALETGVVGGDFYEIWPVEDSWMIVIGDVTGKGVEAAALTALARHTLRTASEFRSSPAELLALLDRTLKQRSTLSVCTALCLRLRGSRVEMAAGGHPLPLLLAAGEVAEVGAPGPLLGAFADVSWSEHRLELEQGDALVLYTDGVTDGLGDGRERFGIERLRATLGELAGASAEQLIAELAARIRSFQIGPPADDTAAVALRRSPAGAAPPPASGAASTAGGGVAHPAPGGAPPAPGEGTRASAGDGAKSANGLHETRNREDE